MNLNEVFDFYDHYVGSYLKERIKTDRSKNEVHLVNFLVHLENTVGLAHIGRDWFNMYMIWQLDYWRTKTVKFGSNLSFTKVIGKKSLDRFIKRSPDYNWHMAKKNLQVKPMTQDIRSPRVDLRSMYQNLQDCLINHLSYNGSKSCITCRNMMLCRKL